MEKTNFCILLFMVLLISLCNSQYDDTYDDYENDEYNYNEYDDYSQELNYYYDQNLLAPPNSGRPSQENTELTEPSRLGIITKPSRAIPSRASRSIYFDFDFKN